MNLRRKMTSSSSVQLSLNGPRSVIADGKMTLSAELTQTWHELLGNKPGIQLRPDLLIGTLGPSPMDPQTGLGWCFELTDQIGDFVSKFQRSLTKYSVRIFYKKYKRMSNVTGTMGSDFIDNLLAPDLIPEVPIGGQGADIMPNGNPSTSSGANGRQHQEQLKRNVTHHLQEGTLEETTFYSTHDTGPSRAKRFCPDPQQSSSSAMNVETVGIGARRIPAINLEQLPPSGTDEYHREDDDEDVDIENTSNGDPFGDDEQEVPVPRIPPGGNSVRSVASEDDFELEDDLEDFGPEVEQKIRGLKSNRFMLKVRMELLKLRKNSSWIRYLDIAPYAAKLMQQVFMDPPLEVNGIRLHNSMSDLVVEEMGRISNNYKLQVRDELRRLHSKKDPNGKSFWLDYAYYAPRATHFLEEIFVR